MQQLFDLPEQYDEMLNKGIGVTGNDKHFFIKGRLNLLLQKLPRDFKPQRILDFGCGTGATSKELSTLFPEAIIVGTDLSDSSIGFAGNIYKADNLNFIEFSNLQKCEPFDLVYLNCVLHHIEPNHRETTMNQLFAICKSNSLLWIFENNPANPGTQLAMYTNPFDKGVVKIWAKELKNRMKSAGFEVLETNFLFYFPQWLSVFRPIEKYLQKLPMGGQYGVLAKKA
jgi:trans-aconitate methyltransferase